MQTKKQKEEIVKELVGKLKTSKAAVFSDFKGLTVKELSELRQDLRQAGIEIKVLKKTLINIALRDAGIDLDTKTLEGQIALAISQEDEVAAARIIEKASRATENLKIVGGILGNRAILTEEVKALAKLPSKEELLAKLVGTLNAPVSGFVNVMAGNLRGLVQVLKAIGETK